MIYIVRHGQTNWNLEGRNQGQTNIELNDTGIKQANIIKKELNNIDFDLVFSSPLIRAYKTATIITNKKIIKDDRLLERFNGKLEGKLRSEYESNIDFASINETRYDIELLQDFIDRIEDFLKEILKKYKNKNILIVTHAGVSIYMKCFLYGEPLDGNYGKLKLKNCEILEYNNS